MFYKHKKDISSLSIEKAFISWTGTEIKNNFAFSIK